jgi:hypothetical protein
MSGEPHESQKDQIALALAQGSSLRKWAEANGVPKSTAYRWAEDPEVKARANAIRRRFLNRAVGRLTAHVNTAAGGVIELGESAKSEAVKLRALRAIFSDMISVSRFGGLEDRIAALEEQSRDHTGNAP